MPDNPKHPLFWVAPVLLVLALSFFIYPGISRAPYAPAGLVQKQALAVPAAHVLVAGDMMFDRSVRAAMDAHGGDFVFSCIDDTLKNADLVVANLEGPITDNQSLSLGSIPNTPANYTFTFAPATAALLFAHHVRLVNLGNNHVRNYGLGGEAATKLYLEKAGVEYFGDPSTKTVAYESVQGVRLAFINYNEFAPQGATSAASTTVAQIQEAKLTGFVPVVYTHWGVEYASTSPKYIQDLAHAFVDAGAAIVVGSHPHVVEQREVYKGAYIYYSLGNFIFDQYFSPAVQQGLVLSLTFTQQGVASVTELPVVLGHDRRTCLQ